MNGNANKQPASSDQNDRFFFEGVSAPIRATVDSRHDEGFTLRQALPFLSLKSALHDEAGRGGTLEGVSVQLLDGVPNLVLDVRYEMMPPPQTPKKAKRRDATVPYLMESTRAARATKLLVNETSDRRFGLPAPNGSERRDSTVPFAFVTDECGNEVFEPIADPADSLSSQAQFLDFASVSGSSATTSSTLASSAPGFFARLLSWCRHQFSRF